MPCWYYEKEELKNTLSIQDGMDYDTECRYRKEGAQLISDIGIKLELGYNTIATGVVYFHRFYMFQSFKTFPRNVTACCCLFLAGKVEETPKKCKDILITAKTLLSEREFKTFGHDPINEIMILERILLQTIKFDLEVEHPYGYLLGYAKSFKGDRNKIRKMLQMAWTFVNDSLRTTLSLQWEAEVIAVALMYLAGKLSKLDVSEWQGSSSKHLKWWNTFVEDVTKDLQEGTSELSIFVFKNLDKKHFEMQSFIDICHQVMEPYFSTTESSSTTSSSSEPDKNKPLTQTSDHSTSNASNSNEHSSILKKALSSQKLSKLDFKATTPAKISAKIDAKPVDIQGRLPIDVPSHYPPYRSAFAQENPAYLPSLAPANVTAPSTLANYIVPLMHINVGGPVGPPTQSTFHQTDYPSNLNYYSGVLSAPPSAWPDYPPQV